MSADVDDAYYRTVLENLDDEQLETVEEAAATLASAADRLETLEEENGVTDVADEFGKIVDREHRIAHLARDQRR